MGPVGRFEVEDQLRIALEQAKATYEATKQECNRIKIYAVDVGNTHPDGAFAHQQALKKQLAAAERYRQALFAFNRFIIGRKPLL
jgi:hypothetical protein